MVRGAEGKRTYKQGDKKRERNRVKGEEKLTPSRG